MCVYSSTSWSPKIVQLSVFGFFFLDGTRSRPNLFETSAQIRCSLAFWVTTGRDDLRVCLKARSPCCSQRLQQRGKEHFVQRRFPAQSKMISAETVKFNDPPRCTMSNTGDLIKILYMHFYLGRHTLLAASQRKS